MRGLRKGIEGEVLFDDFSRGRYSTDASIYQIEPVGVVVPRHARDVATALTIAESHGVPVLPRGAGTSQCGQTVGAALIIDHTKYLNHIAEFDAESNTVWVEPGVVLDELNAYLRPHGVFYPVDVSTAAQATLGGMAGNNSCGSRSLRYGNMVHNVQAIDAWIPGGELMHFGPQPAVSDPVAGSASFRALVKSLRDICRREAAEIDARFPKLLRRVGGYNLDLLSHQAFNLAQLLVGSEGTLACFKRIQLKLQPIAAARTLGVCHFASFYQAMECTQHIVELGPTAVELVDRTMIELARGSPVFRPIVERFLRGEPDALLLVEFAGDTKDEQIRQLGNLVQLMADRGFPGSVVEVTDAGLQRDIWEVRKAGLNIMMSMKGDGKPVSFIEDCAVPLEHLAEYTNRLTQVFHKHGTSGTWYAHASVGCLHVRPILNMKDADGAKKMRAIAEEAADMVRQYKGSFSGEHGDGLVRSEWIEPMFGGRLTRAFEEIKNLFDPKNLFNPGKIVRPSKMDDRSLFRFKPGYRVQAIDTALDWSQWGGFGAAVEMCNNNGACRKRDASVMCPSFRATGDEQDVTRGRANSLRLALSGQLGAGALSSEAMHATMGLCVSCKGCKRECPTGVDMARMKIEFLHQYRKTHRLTLRDRLVAYLPRYASYLSPFGPVLNFLQGLPLVPWLAEKLFGLTRHRRLPSWKRSDTSASPEVASTRGEVVLWADTFTRYFEPDNYHAAHAVLTAAGYRVHELKPVGGSRPLCCGRTFLSAGLVEEARFELRRVLRAMRQFENRDMSLIALEPACLMTLRDELLSLLPGEESRHLATQALTLEEFLAREHQAGRLDLRLRPRKEKVLLHGHCHQKAFGAFDAMRSTLSLIPDLQVDVIESSCCGMAGSFGYETEHYDVSMKMAEASLLPRIRLSEAESCIVADGVSCRQQILHGSGRQARHAVQLLYASVYPDQT
jgi:FAD/FMN-containing dehydrogenase/Fe-S oxidoreductase